MIGRRAGQASTGYALRVFPRANHTAKEIDEPGNDLHLSTAGHHQTGFHPWLKIQSARWLRFASARTVQARIVAAQREPA